MQLTVNDRLLETDDSDSRTLLRYLRDALQLTGTKDGCDGAGHCGTCTVLVDGRPTLACRTAMQAVTGRHVLTIEGLSRRFHNGLHPVQQSFIDHHAVQCGFCTPGMILAAAALLDSPSAPTLANIKLALQGNLCRCTGYQKIFDAVLALPPLPRGEGGGVAVRPERGVRPAVGLSVPNKGDEDKVTGRETYSADIYRPGMLAGKVVWSEHPHAEIVEVDTESARTLPGVAAVLTAADVPGVNLHGPIIRDQPVLAQHKVRFIGEPVAVVLAETELQAEAAARAVHVAYRPLPPVFDPIEAMNPEAPLLHTDCPRNILTHQPVRVGDAARALDASAIVITGEYAVPFIEHAYLEPEAAVAEPDGQGGIKLWCGVQNQFQTLRQIAAALALPLERINMVNLPMGGAFGGKCDITVQALAALGALVTGRPVKIVLTRAESLRVHPKRHAFKMRYRTGVTQDGLLTGIDAEIVADTGAYASWGSITAETLATFVCGPYVVPNVHVDLYAVHTNNITAGAMRGFGAPEVAFAVESQMDRLARALSMDPFSFRAVNGIDRGRALYLGQVLEHSVGYQQTLSEVQRALEVHLPACKAIAQQTGRRLGVGVASGFKSVGFSANWPDPAAAEVRLLSSGHVQLSTGCADFGQGSMTTVAQIAAETLGVNYADVELRAFESQTSPDGGPSYASRTTYVQGNAVKMAAERFRERLCEFAAECFDVAPTDVLLERGQLIDARRETVLADLTRLAELAEARGETLAAHYEHAQQSTVQTTDVARSGYFGEKRAHDFMYSTYAFATQVAIVAVDTATGRVEALKMIAAHDVGRAIHPHNIEGQLQGACAIGLGTALWERFRLRDGWNVTNSLRRTLIPDSCRIPEIVPVIVEDEEPTGPYGAKGIAEIAAIPSAAAVVNAITDAVGVEFNEIPVTRGRLLQALRRTRSSVAV